MSLSLNKLYAYIGCKDIVLRERTALSYTRIYLLRDPFVNLFLKKVSATEVTDACIGMSSLGMKSKIKMEIMVR